jgi:hypothetical protein
MAATSYQLVEDRSVEAQVYSVLQDDAVFNVTVADIGLEGSAVIDVAIKMMSADRLQQHYFTVDGAVCDAKQRSAAG